MSLLAASGEQTIFVRSRCASSDLILFGAWYCPYVQRVWIALEYSKINYIWNETILYQNSDPSCKKSLTLQEKSEVNHHLFITSSPRGLVPAILHGDTQVADSLAILEYIDEAFLEVSLMPTVVSERAKIRCAINLFAEIVIRRFYSLLMSETSESRKDSASALLSGFQEIASYFCSESPFFSSFGFSLFECSSLPWYQRTLSVLKHYRGFVLPIENKSFKRLSDWYEACLTVPAFASTLVDHQKLIDNYRGYADNTGAEV